MNSYRRTPTVEAGMKVVGRQADGAVAFVQYEPGNMTRYPVVIHRMGEEAACASGFGPGAVLVTLLWGVTRSMVVHPDGCPSVVEFREALDVSLADAVVLMELLGHVLGMPCLTTEAALEQGEVAP